MKTLKQKIKEKIFENESNIDELGGKLYGMSELAHRGFLDGYITASKQILGLVQAEEDCSLFLKKVADLFKYMYTEYTDCEALFWSQTKGENKLFVNCNDLFFWACDDAEEVTKDNIDILKECLEISLDYGSDLFCCKIRGMRPQGCIYSGISEDLHHYFDACGPERIVDMGNPVDQRDWKNYRDGKPMAYPLIIEIKGMDQYDHEE